MAQGVRFICEKCGYAIEAWSDGNPYYLNANGVKQYAYHPDHDGLARCIGNDVPHICMSCGQEIMVDSRAPINSCPNCGKTELAQTFHLGGRRCPHCKAGVFVQDPDFNPIS